MHSHLPPSILASVRNYDDTSSRLLHDVRNREPLPPEQLAAYQHLGDYQAQLPPLTSPAYFDRNATRWLTTVVHSLAGALAAFAQATMLQPPDYPMGVEPHQVNAVTIVAAADHLRHVARLTQQLSAGLAVHLDVAPLQQVEADAVCQADGPTVPHAEPQPSAGSGSEQDQWEEMY